jgi:hypothetical protein
MWQAAGFPGMSEKTLRDTYGHHHPDFLREAADAIASRPAPKKVALVFRWLGKEPKGKGPRKPLKLLVGPAGLEPATRPL